MSDSPLATAAKSAQPKAKKAAPVEPAAVVVKAGDPVAKDAIAAASQEHGEKIIPSIGDPYDGPLMIDLGFKDLVEFSGGYVPSRPELDLTPMCREAIKRLALTLEQRQERLSDGSEIRGSVPKTIVWLCEKFAAVVN